jgi:preprotein translocase subunit SecG
LYFLEYKSDFYKDYRQNNIIQITGLVLAVTFSGIIFLISILNEYNSPEANNMDCPLKEISCELGVKSPSI